MQRFIFIFFLFLFFSSPAYSAVILKIKGRKALIDLEGVQAGKGDRFDALNLYGKALGLLEIKQVKKGKAVAVLLKGKMGINWILEPTSQSTSSSFASEEEYDPVGVKPKSTSLKDSSFLKKSNFVSNGVGLIAGINFNSVAVSTDKSISGSSLQGALFADFFIINPLAVRLILGYQQLIASGSDCGLSSCQLLIHYPGAGVFLRGVFLTHLMFQPWIGGGGFLFWPLVHRTANLGLDKKSFSGFHGALTAALGIDIHFGSFYIPLQVSVNWINPVVFSLQSLKPGSRQFKPFYIGINTGVAISF
ncbi:MAG: hypothetical protein OXM55_08405 [Bdellovibrionales bacterium]|nr:hypothetical protein [Bdellovibrionales bacterium]